MNKNELIGQKFGKLMVIGKTDHLEERYRVWLCRCDCGNSIEVNTRKLKRGTVLDCGCGGKKRRANQKEDLVGQKFGQLTVLSESPRRMAGRISWNCLCTCGNQKIITSQALKSGKTKSCGCLRKKNGNKMQNLSGRKFKRLTVLYPTNERDQNGSVIWHCRCECGKECNVSADSLQRGNTVSCGCKRKEQIAKIHGYLTFVNGTCIEWLEKRKNRSDNTSGFRGVYRTKEGKYRVTVGLCGKRYHVGIFSDYGKAVKARLEAEQELQGSFLEAYNKWQSIPENNEKEFRYQVKKDDNHHFQLECII